MNDLHKNTTTKVIFTAPIGAPEPADVESIAVADVDALKADGFTVNDDAAAFIADASLTGNGLRATDLPLPGADPLPPAVAGTAATAPTALAAGPEADAPDVGIKPNISIEPAAAAVAVTRISRLRAYLAKEEHSAAAHLHAELDELESLFKHPA